MGLTETYVNIKQYNDYEIRAYHLEQNEAVYVLDALEKQIPKKPIDAHHAKVTSSGLCPSCGREIIYIHNDDSSNMRNYCRYCGQKIDWFHEE